MRSADMDIHGNQKDQVCLLRESVDSCMGWASIHQTVEAELSCVHTSLLDNWRASLPVHMNV